MNMKVMKKKFVTINEKEEKNESFIKSFQTCLIKNELLNKVQLMMGE